MIIAVAIKDSDEASQMSHHFGRSGYFLLIDNADNSRRIVRNPYSETFGGAGIQTAQLLIENNADVVIVSRIGSHALRILSTANIKVYNAGSEKVEDALQAFEDESLVQFDTAFSNLSGRKGSGNRYRFHGRNSNY